MKTTYLVLVLLLSIFLLSCEIEESPVSPRGLLRIDTIDSLSNTALEGISIFIDSIPQTQTTPAIIGPLAAKTYQVSLRSSIYANRNYTVTIRAGDTTHLEAKLNRAALGYLTITSTPSGAKIIVDEKYARDSLGIVYVTPATIPVAEGNRIVSVALSGYLTVHPSLHQIDVSQNSTYPLSFGLEATSIGRSIGILPNPFRQRILQSDTTRRDTLDLEQYRGHLVMLSCWFTTCTPCRLELPYFASTYNEFANRRVRFISPTTPVGLQRDLELLESGNQLGISYPLTFDWQGRFWSSMDGRTPPSYPLNVLIDTTGAIVFNGGSLSESELRELIHSHLP